MADPDRNLPASARKIRRAREDGQVPRSRDLGHFMSLALAAALLFTAMPALSSYAQHLVADGLHFDRSVVESPALAGEQAVSLFGRGLVVVLAAGLLFMVTGVAANLALGGWNLTFKAIHPDFGRVNPISGFGRLFNLQHLVVTLKAILLALVIGVSGGFYLRAHFATLGGVLSAPLPEGLSQVGATLGGGLLAMLGVLAASALIDVPLQRKQFLDRLKMTREEVKKEHKETEGSGEVKQKMKQKMRELARRRMMKAVPAADIVVMNPTHYAVALKYDQAAMGAPRVVAKGFDRLAMRIRDLARDAGVPVLEAPPLARALYTHVELDAEVPAMLFAAVAQILAWVYQLRRTSGIAPPSVHVPPELDPLTGGTRAELRQRRARQPAASE